jgi:hypothetical protein
LFWETDFFLGKKERPTEVPFLVRKKRFPKTRLSQRAGIASKKNKNVIKKVSRKNSLWLSVLVFVNEIECSTFQGLEVAKLSLGLIPRAFVITNQYF